MLMVITHLYNIHTITVTKSINIFCILLLQPETSFMTFEGVQLQGTVKIMEKLNVSESSSVTLWKLLKVQFD